ncbi:TfoX/Sxy family protein [Nocardioides marmoraquaticus]
MPYDAELAERVRDVLETTPGLDRDVVSEKRMFGGLAFLVDDLMALAVTRDGLMMRVDPEAEEQLLARPEVEPMVMRDRPVHGWVLVGPSGCEGTDDLRSWVDLGVGRAQGLAADVLLEQQRHA